MAPIRLVPREEPNACRAYAAAVRDAARAWFGRGELPAKNNRGPDIDAMLAISGVGRRDDDGHSLGGPWCGVGSSTALLQGAQALGWPGCPFPLHAGAKRLGRNVGRWGRYLVKPRGWTVLGGGTYRGDLSPEDVETALVVVWHRGKSREKSWQGHIEIPIRYNDVSDTLYTAAPNVAPSLAVRNELIDAGFDLYPRQAVWHQRVHKHGKWRRKLCLMAGC